MDLWPEDLSGSRFTLRSTALCKRRRSPTGEKQTERNDLRPARNIHDSLLLCAATATGTGSFRSG
ncbi:hypothetical protein TIFTF001_042663 [Ficus carica]|uniref:Uncharacterized protein n=1 Tax=Ficus carica TaxID=3494 RepID=A0AA88D0D7_FICCA|nr:hypothetical protein TIFTF001_042663 [Ficus carica]